MMLRPDSVGVEIAVSPMPKSTLHHQPNSHFDQSIAQLSPSLQREMQELRKSEAKIVKLLSDPKKAESFLANPLQFLEKGGIAVPTLLKRRLQQFDSNLVQHLKQQAFALPNGQTVTACIKV